MKIRAYITHKNAEKYSDCADYFGICPQHKRVAVSDGVTQSIMPLEWAKILVSAFLDKSWDPKLSISPLQQKWYEEAVTFLNTQRSQGINPWMLENCLTNRDGAGATFCGIVFEDKSHWIASILGDSSLVLLDTNDEIVEIISSKEGVFDNRPDYFDSFTEQYGVVKHVNGELKKDQKILLVSDPFSELFQKFQNTSEEHVIIKKLLSLGAYDEYIKLVDVFREHYHMHNDDSTLVIIEFDDSKEFNVIEENTLDSLIKQEYEKEESEKKEKKREELLWQKAMETNTIESYDWYLKSTFIFHHKKQAEKEKENLIIKEKEQIAWGEAEKLNTTSAYQKYLSNYPNELHSQEAKRFIEELTRTSSKSEKGNCQEEQPESSSEDSDICGHNNTFINETHECGMESYEANNTAEISAANANQAISTETNVSEPATSSESKGTTDPMPEITKPSGEDETIETCESINKENMDKQDINQCDDEISLPSTVNICDGIDREEFKALLSTASQLFKKYSPQFQTAFTEPKWRNSPQIYFTQYWIELENIIFNCHG